MKALVPLPISKATIKKLQIFWVKRLRHSSRRGACRHAPHIYLVVLPSVMDLPCAKRKSIFIVLNSPISPYSECALPSPWSWICHWEATHFTSYCYTLKNLTALKYNWTYYILLYTVSPLTTVLLCVEPAPQNHPCGIYKSGRWSAAPPWPFTIKVACPPHSRSTGITFLWYHVIVGIAMTMVCDQKAPPRMYTLIAISVHEIYALQKWRMFIPAEQVKIYESPRIDTSDDTTYLLQQISVAVKRGNVAAAFGSTGCGIQTQHFPF